MSARPQLLLRADASAGIGIGHLMRCVALGQAWQDQGGDVAVGSSSLPDSLAMRLDREGFERFSVPGEPGSPEDARALAEAAERRNAYVALDGYGLGPEYQAIVSEAARRVLLVADHGTPKPGPIDLLLDQNLGAGPDRYPDVPASCQTLLGPRFALLRREFRAAASDPVEHAFPPRHLLVLLGGGDDCGLGVGLLSALTRDRVGLHQVTVVAGPSHPQFDALQANLRDIPATGQLVSDPVSLVPLMQAADVAVSAAGSTCWEMACLGLPAVVAPIADNQEPVAAALEAHGIALAVERDHTKAERGTVALLGRLANDRDAFDSIAKAGMLLVDGDGAVRVARALAHEEQSGKSGDLSLRPATVADTRRLWIWANEPKVRAASFQTNPISWREHLSWLDQRLADPGTRIYVALDESGQPVGQIRFEGQGLQAVVDVSLEAVVRGRGWGQRLIEAGTTRFFEETAAVQIRALVKSENVASRNAFRKAGFTSAGFESHQGQECEVFSLAREQGNV